MGSWSNRLFALLIFLVAGFSIYAVWPDQPERYLPDAIPWPSGQGLPSKVGPMTLPCHSDDTNTNDAANCRGMTLGLDLQGGSRIVLEADVAGQDVSAGEIDDGLAAAKEIIESRINPFGVSESQVQRSGNDRLIVELPGVSAETARDITRPAALMFCEPLQQGSQGSATGSSIATVPAGTRVYYEPGTCRPDVNEDGQIAVAGTDGNVSRNDDGTIQRVQPTYMDVSTAQTSGFPTETMVWAPAMGELNGAPLAMSGTFLKANSEVQLGTLGEPYLYFETTRDGEKVLGSLTERIVGLPLATFLDGEPIRGARGQIIAPIVNDQLTTGGVTTGLSLEDAKRLRTFLNNGAFPIPLTVVQQQDLDATLGDEAVRYSVQAGLVALLLIMAFMTLYYRLPGVLASIALVVYTAVVLAIFKIGIPGSGPVTLTLAGIAAFVLSVGMAVDANILIFERTKEELRNGRSLIPAVDAGFRRAWSSIRDSNVSTLISTAILYWMGSAFASSLIKGFAITLAIGVIISMFSAITVTRTLLKMAVGTPLARKLWLWTDDAPDPEGAPAPRMAPGMEEVEHA